MSRDRGNLKSPLRVLPNPASSPTFLRSLSDRGILVAYVSDKVYILDRGEDSLFIDYSFPLRPGMSPSLSFWSFMSLVLMY